MFNLLALVRRHSLYLLLWSSQGAMFLLNSRQGDFSCGPTARRRSGRPYTEGTAAFLPNSLRIFHSFALVYSTRPPVLVCGTGPVLLPLEVFLGRLLLRVSPSVDGRPSSAWVMPSGFAWKAPLHCRPESDNRPGILTSVTPSKRTGVMEY